MQKNEIRYPNYLKHYRVYAKLTQKEVAKILGFKHEARISKWEKGIQLPNVINLFKLSIIYKAPVQDLYLDLIHVMMNKNGLPQI